VIFSDTQRNDPVLREKVAQVIEARRMTLLKAAEMLKAVSDMMRPLELGGDDAIYSRSYEKVRRAAFSVASDAEFRDKLLTGDTECYIGNQAASGLGNYILKKEAS
jgi:hypothetical protein